jgi:hypothetical protein
MGIFSKKPEPQSWSGETASQQKASGKHGKQPPEDVPNNPCRYGHRRAVEVSRDAYDKKRWMTCQSCGQNWTEKL